MEEETEKDQETTRPSEPDGALSDDEKQDRDGNPAKKVQKGGRSFPGMGLLNKRVLAMTAGLIFLFAGLGIVKEHPMVREWIGAEDKKSTGPEAQFHSQEEDIPPLFIPVSGDGSKRVIMVSFSAIWDSVASIHFERMEIEIRDQIYQRLKELAEKRANIAEEIPGIEFEIQKILRRMMGRVDVDIRVKEIKAY